MTMSLYFARKMAGMQREFRVIKQNQKSGLTSPWSHVPSHSLSLKISSQLLFPCDNVIDGLLSILDAVLNI